MARWCNLAVHVENNCGGVSETFLYPIYGGMILLAGLIVGCTVVVVEEVKSIKEEIKNLRNTDSEKE